MKRKVVLDVFVDFEEVSTLMAHLFYMEDVNIDTVSLTELQNLEAALYGRLITEGAQRLRDALPTGAVHDAAVRSVARRLIQRSEDEHGVIS